MLLPPRRETLAREWVVPTGGAAALEEDWESFEALLRTLSDFLHDGISLRQPLSDALDLLAEESAEAGISCAKDLRKFLFAGNKLIANAENPNDPRNSDLAWVIAEGRSNPLGLCLVFVLVGRRMGFDVEGVNFPGHFLCRIFEDGYPIIIDCYDHGRIHLQLTLLESPELNRNQRQALRQTADLGTILLRLLNNLYGALEEHARDEDALLIRQLQSTLE
jgi:regulator of sirC expression with transglutaminase-like and TPR domain